MWAWDRQLLGWARTMTRMSVLTMCIVQGTTVAAGQKGRGEKGMRFGDEEGALGSSPRSPDRLPQSRVSLDHPWAAAELGLHPLDPGVDEVSVRRTA